MKFIDLFAGIGGFHLALARVGMKCVYANEWDRYATEIYKKHFGEVDTKDFTKVKADEIPDHDLLCAGFPCQAFSIAGKRKGFEDTRGTLFFDIARILKHKKPRYFLLENVKGLLSHSSGETFSTMLRILSEIGYELQWEVLNSKNFGVPQNRERVFVIGHLRGERRPKVFPIRKSNKNDKKENEQRNDFSHTIQPGDKYRGSYVQYGTSQDQKLSMKYSQSLNAGHYNQPKIAVMKEITKNVSDAQRIYDISGIAKTLKGLGGGLGAKTGLYATPKIRRLTPIECERLQGFPDGWTEGLSDTQRYKCLGNAVTVNVVEEIGKRLFKNIIN